MELESILLPGVEVSQQCIDGLGVAPLADGVGPQGNISGLAGLGGLCGSGGLGGGGGGSALGGGSGGGTAAAAYQQAGSHTGGQNRGYLLFHTLFSFLLFAFRPCWGHHRSVSLVMSLF